MNHRVLIISPHFPPINAADHQRVRMTLPYFQEFGWSPHVLAVQPERIESPLDPVIEKTVPDEIPVTRVNAFSTQYTRYVGLGDLGWRSLPFLGKAGAKLLQEEEFDLVYFSTTVFLSMALSSHWWKKFRVPYILDFQDPWLNYYYQKSGTNPPGGWLKYGFSQKVAQFSEPHAMRYVSHVTSVSPAYPETLRQRYPWLTAEQFTVLPFGAPEKDFELLSELQVKQNIFDPQDGKQHWVYVGRGGQDMALALHSLFLAIQQERDRAPDRWSNVKLHFIGTSYAPKGRRKKAVEPIASEYGLSDIVEELPERIPYFEALKVLVDSDVILLIGSDDPGYSASKLYPCVLARKPILAIFHHQSLVVKLLQEWETGHVVTFTAQSQPHDLVDSLKTQLNYLANTHTREETTTNWDKFSPYTAREMTRKLCNLFDKVANSNDSST